MKISDFVNHDLESFRRASVAAVMKSVPELKRLAEATIREPIVKIKPAGDVLTSGKFTADTEVEAEFFLVSDMSGILDEEASMLLTQALSDHQIEPFGVLTCKVYR